MPRANPRAGRAMDYRALASALSGPGIDTRMWASYGTVCTVSDEGEANETDDNAVICAPDGVYVDVLLQPIGIPVTCRVQLGVGGQCTLYVPIHAGDEVLVTIPDGNLMNAPVVSAILNSMAKRLPLESDKKPIFRNDRVSFHARGVPMDIRSGSTKVVLDHDGKAVLHSDDVRLGGDSASQKLIKGDIYTVGQKAFLEILKTYAGAIQSVADPSGLATAALNVGIEAFKTVINNSLSDVSKTR